MLDQFQRMRQRLEDDPHLVRLGRLFSETVLIEVDGAEHYLVFEKGRVVSVEPGPSRKTPWRFALRVEGEALAKFWEAAPEPGYHDIFGFVKTGRGRIEGDILALVKNLRFFKAFMALGRPERPRETPAAPPAPASFEPVEGRYLAVEAGGRRQRVYVEMAGEGRPVLCLHTAGADSRQWRHVLNDAELTATHRFHAFDMPWHGKSLPPEGWQGEEYLLTTEAYMETVLALVSALRLEKPVLAGCSMGGRIALQLAALHPEHFSGFIAIEASDFQPAWYDIDWFHRPDAPGSEMGAALVSANISPLAPEARRWDTLWMFMQSGPGVFRGDLSFYTRDASLVERLARIDTARTPVHLLVGAYDMTCTPEDAARTAAAIPGATIEVMPELGHFPMSEHPEGFRPYFARALARMAG